MLLPPHVARGQKYIQIAGFLLLVLKNLLNDNFT